MKLNRTIKAVRFKVLHCLPGSFSGLEFAPLRINNRHNVRAQGLGTGKRR